MGSFGYAQDDTEYGKAECTTLICPFGTSSPFIKGEDKGATSFNFLKKIETTQTEVCAASI
jgi:hypothetical protein